MADPHFAGDDDLPRALRRERDSREREQREREAAMAAQHQPYPQSGYGTDMSHQDYANPDQASLYPIAGSGVVNRLEIPFLHLVWFFMKAVFAAIPAVLLLIALLWGGSQIVKRLRPELMQFEVKFYMGPVNPSALNDAGNAALPGAPPATKR